MVINAEVLKLSRCFCAGGSIRVVLGGCHSISCFHRSSHCFELLKLYHQSFWRVWRITMRNSWAHINWPHRQQGNRIKNRGK